MPILLFVIFFSQLYEGPRLLNLLAPIVQFMHPFCLKLTLNYSAYAVYNAALVCSYSLYESSHISAIKHLGLLHLFVVSGFHLNLMSRGLEKVFSKRTSFNQLSISILLMVYAFFCALKAPVLRAFIQWLWPDKRMSLPLKIFYVGNILLMIEDDFWNSLSLQLSWTASLLITFPHFKLSSKLIIIYVSFYILLSPFPIPHPISILSSQFFSPIVAFILLPMALLNTIFFFITPITDEIWKSFMFIISQLSRELPLLTPQFELSLSHKWYWLFTLNLLLFYLDVLHRRKSLCA